MLKQLTIKNLFGRFNYDIHFKNEGVTIITGPNGYGKSTILKCIEAISMKNISFFVKLDFSSISFIFEEENIPIFISKDDNGFNFNGILIPKDLTEEISIEYKLPPYILKFNNEIWIDKRTDEIIDPIEYKFKRAFMNNKRNNFTDLDESLAEKLDQLLTRFKEQIGSIYYIKEQRLIIEKRTRRAEQEVVNIIEDLPNKFKDLISEISNNYSATANKLDGSYPYRLFKTQIGISKEEYEIKMKEMNAKFEKLKKYDISEMQNSGKVSFEKEHAKALKIYFDDFEKKYMVYEDFVKKLDLFTNIVNSRLSFKEIKISRENGIIVTDNEYHEKYLDLNQLSSGEKQEIVLFYELIFETADDVLLLIDEPEISLHIIWQKMFMNDLLMIVKYKKFKVVVATHSPQIINNHWDKQIDLGELYSAQFN